MLRVISEVKPRWIVAENVRGLLSIESGQVFAEIITSLESEGYEVVTFCIPASAVNAPHKRDRLWIIANTESVFARGLSVRKKAQNSRNQQRSCNAWGESWLDIALRTCVRGMDDGLSDELDIVGSRDNRTNRLKALGNSIIPAIAYEIFRAIEQAESEFIERSA